jgi:PGF-pre-PGF domain-containing protein
MPKCCSLFKSSSHDRELDEKTKINNSHPWRNTCTRTHIIFTAFLLWLSLCGIVAASSFPPAPPQQIVVEETAISVSLTTPASVVFINVTEYDAQQIVKNVTLEFREPVTYVNFTLKVLSEKPSYVNALNNPTAPQYYTITFLSGVTVTDKIANAEMNFAIKKDTEQKKDVDVETLVLYQYNGEKMEECPTEKVTEDDAFLYFRTKTEGPSYVAVTGGTATLPWWLDVATLAVAALIAVIAIYGYYRRLKLAHLKKLSRTGYGK